MRREEGREEYIEKLKKKWEIKENESKEQKRKEEIRNARILYRQFLKYSLTLLFFFIRIWKVTCS